MRKVKILSTLLAMVLLSTSLFSSDLKNLKKRVAVVSFTDKANYGHNIGNGIADMLVTSLVESKKFIVIERNELDKIMQSLGCA